MANSEAALRWLAKDPPKPGRGACSPAAHHPRRRAHQRGGRAHAAACLTKDFGRVRPLDLNALLDVALLFTEIQRKRSSVKVETAYARGSAVDLRRSGPDPAGGRHLISNAVDAMKKPVCPQAHPQGLDLALGDWRVVVSVADTGTGVDDSNLEHIFTHLFTTPKSGGMGLGLPISKAIVEAHGGRLTMARNEPFGAVFRFHLAAMDS